MDLEQKQLLIRIAFLVVGAVGVALLARRKGQNQWAWGAIGGAAGFFMPLLLVIPIALIGFLGFRCIKCGAPISESEVKKDGCPLCIPRK